MPEVPPSATTSEVAEPRVPSGGPVAILVEDDPQIRHFLRRALPNHGYRLFEAATGTEGLREAETRMPDIIILDLGLPDLDGLEVIQRLREWTTVPIVVLSARGQERDKVAALDAGADDYVSKPFGIAELLARLRVALRHAARTAEQKDDLPITVGSLHIDLLHRRVVVSDREIHLTPIEYRLLATLAKQAGKILTQRQLLTEVWGPPYADQAHYLRVYMAQLRRKVEADPTRPKYLLTEAGVGYRLAVE